MWKPLKISESENTLMSPRCNLLDASLLLNTASSTDSSRGDGFWNFFNVFCHFSSFNQAVVKDLCHTTRHPDNHKPLIMVQCTQNNMAFTVHKQSRLIWRCLVPSLLEKHGSYSTLVLAQPPQVLQFTTKVQECVMFVLKLLHYMCEKRKRKRQRSISVLKYQNIFELFVM